MAANQLDNQLRISWHDSAWIPILNAENILDYFCQRTNPFYDRTCNNEVVKMQRLDPAQLKLMTGVEYELIHGQDPILYVIRKQQRHSPTQVTYLAVYYILAGVVYQCPDLGSVLNSRLLSTVQNLELAFDEAVSYSRYTPSKGYWWQFQDSSSENKSANKKPKKAAEPGSLFQRQRVDILLSNFLSKFPPKVLQPTPTTNQPVDTSNLKTEDTSSETPNSKEQSSDSGTVGTASQKPGLNNPVDVKNVTCRVASPVVNTGIQRVSTPDSKPLTPPSKKRKI